MNRNYPDHLRIATRQSPMALWQAEFIKHKISEKFPELSIELVTRVTQGDKNLSAPLTDLGGKLLFVKELQHALLNDEADIAVHCIKDMSVHPCDGLTLATIYQRDDPRDALVSKRYASLDELPPNARIGTASPRRQCLLNHLRDDLELTLCRGNVNTRLRKLTEGAYDAIILAKAGLDRLGFTDFVMTPFDPSSFIPSIGQGALGIEAREGDEKIHHWIQHLNHPRTARCVTAERAVNRVLGGDCHTPIGAYAIEEDDTIHLRAMVGAVDGRTLLRATLSGAAAEAKAIGQAVAADLLAQGAAQLLNLGDND